MRQFDWLLLAFAMPSIDLRKIVKSVVFALFLLNALFGCFMAMVHLNILQYDFSGHIWSSIQISRGLFHNYSDQIFLGTTQNLFYPPTEDVLNSLLSKFSGLNAFYMYSIYLSLVICFYFLVIWKLSKSMHSTKALIFFATSILFLTNLEKVDSLKLQGLSFVDLFITGLSSETLSFCFFLLFIDSSWIAERPKKILSIIFLSLTIISHIVIGLVALLFMCLNIIYAKDKTVLVKITFISLGLSSFYLLPIIAYRQYMAPSTIYSYEPWSAFAIAIAATLAAHHQKNSKSCTMLLTATILLSLSTVLPYCNWAQTFLPKFHYYRFTMVAYFLTAIGLSLLIEKIRFNFKSRSNFRDSDSLAPLISLLFIFHLSIDFNLQKYDFRWISLQKTLIDLRKIGNLNFNNYGRYFILGDDRAPDTGVDSILAASFENFRSTKGLYWESSRTNTLQSSFLATVLSPPVVLDHFYYPKLSCEMRKCMLDQSFRYYNVKGLVSSQIENMSYLTADAIDCFKEIINIGTSYFQFEKSGEFSISSDKYDIFKSTYKKNAILKGGYSVEPIELLSPQGIRIQDSQFLNPYSMILTESYKSCAGDPSAKQSLQVIAKPNDSAEILKLLRDTDFKWSKEVLRLHFQKLSNNEFKIFAPDDKKRTYIVKLSPQPGNVAYSSDGTRLSLFETYPYIVIYGAGVMTLRFEKTLLMYFGYIISTLFLLWLIFVILNSQTANTLFNRKKL